MLTSGFMLWAIAGLSAGLMIGLAGAGGGIIGIPVLIYLGHMSFREASGYSLIIVTLGAVFSWYAQRKFTRFRISLIIVLTSVIMSYLVADYKHEIPQWIDIVVLWGVCLYGLYRIWTLDSEKLTPRTQGEPYQFQEYILAAICGVALGVLVTLIGIGGGLVTVPFLLVVVRLPIKEAISTDIFSILLVAPFSAWAQGRFDISLEDLAGLLGGVIIAVFVFDKLRKFLPKGKMKFIRKSILSLAITLALLSSIIKEHTTREIEHEYQGVHHAEAIDNPPTF